jgi:hypothetical protein
LLYSAAVGASAFLAGVKLPRELYNFFGGRLSLQVVLGEAIVIALLLMAFSLVWSYLTVVPLGPLRRGHRPTTSWCMGGVGVAWLGWTIYGAIYFSINPRTYTLPLINLLVSSVTPPLWGMFNVVGVVAGVWLAGRIVTRARDAAIGAGMGRRRHRSRSGSRGSAAAV